MAYANRDLPAVTLNWTNPEYRLNTGPNSQTVTYLLEIDTLGANFTNPRKVTFSFNGALSRTLTQGELNNSLLVGMRLQADREYTLEMRVTSSLGLGVAALVSNRLTLRVMTFSIPPVVDPPLSGRLWITGSATPANWMSNGSTPPTSPSQEFTRVSNTRFVINSLALNGGGSFLLVPNYGDWGDKYGFTGGGNQNNPMGDTFRRGGNDFQGPATSGNYRIEVDFQLGTYTLTRL